MPRVAVIDVGTNSVKLLVGDTTAAGEVSPIWETSEQTRLGGGSYDSQRLQPEAVERTAVCVARLAEAARARGAECVGVIATSAAREAENAKLLLESVRRKARLEVKVISGDQEAEWTYHGVRSEAGLPTGPLLIVDVGGGSTEFVLGEGRSIRFRRSYLLGTVRLLERLTVGDPPRTEDWQHCREETRKVLLGGVLPDLRPWLGDKPRAACTLVGASGTATVLARLERRVDSYDRSRLDGVAVSLDRLRTLREALWALPLESRRQLPGMPADRADVMLTGAAIYEEILAALGVEALRVSLRGLRFGAALDLW